MVVESFTLWNCFYGYVREQTRRINKRYLWKIYLTCQGQLCTCVYVRFSSCTLAYLWCLGFVFCLKTKDSGDALWPPEGKAIWGWFIEWQYWLLGEEERARASSWPGKDRKSTGLFIFFLAILERERDLDRVQCYCINAIIYCLIEKFFLRPDIGRYASWLHLPTSPRMHYWLVVYK